MLIVADGDGHPDAVRREIENDLASRSPDLAEQTDIIVLEPTFEEALEVTGGSPAERRELARNPQLLDDKLRAVGVRQVAARNPAVRQLLRELGYN